jgi:hypothetical protein
VRANKYLMRDGATAVPSVPIYGGNATGGPALLPKPLGYIAGSGGSGLGVAGMGLAPSTATAGGATPHLPCRKREREGKRAGGLACMWKRPCLQTAPVATS